MGESEVVWRRSFVLGGGKWRIEGIAYRVTPSEKHPDGHKVKCVLIDIENGVPVVLVDNHDDFKYHCHPSLPEVHNVRETLDVKNYKEAIRFFFKKVKEVVA